MDDILKPSDATFRSFYQRGYLAWSEVLDQARARADNTASFLSPLVDSISEACLQHPTLPIGLEPDDSGLITARSTWTTAGHCCDAPLFDQTLHLVAASARPTTIRPTADESQAFLSRLPGKRGAHITVLVLAWAYVLSARWAETVVRATPPAYTRSQAPIESCHLKDDSRDERTAASNRVIVQLGHGATTDASRWWAAVLAAGQGWTATIPHPRSDRHSPWSVSLDCTDIEFSLSSAPDVRGQDSEHARPPSFTTAMQYLQHYCQHHGVEQESRLALAAALLLPLAQADNKRTIPLYTPPEDPKSNVSTQNADAATSVQRMSTEHIDRLLALSINTHGVRALLASVFFEPGVPANACGAWLQGTQAVLQGRGVTSNLPLLAAVMHARSPRVGFLWLGAVMTGAHQKHFSSGRTRGLLGINWIELHAAIWLGVCHSFIQEPVRLVGPDAEEVISRADECRLMFLAQEPPQEGPPIYPYPPLGATRVEDTDLGVQIHVRQCVGRLHVLKFVSITWPCAGGRKETQWAHPSGAATAAEWQLGQQGRAKAVAGEDGSEDVPVTYSLAPGGSHPAIDYSFMDREMDLSENVTRNLFVWMRDQDGYTVAEREVLQHEWVYDSESEDDSEPAPAEGDGASAAYRPGISGPDVGRWMARCVTSRCSSL
ncbi:hypothetical protein Micbo1qcDRAFT_236875 [Microdochium bolleyi]|uniref:Uncharacterized protein n=1 Tax=Microdochium bolleyi TaxID=196109 RepID=A0A136INQ1_9PEZI|nr:hypothetical protein Micbo1qcDRAFT_236875 [Microdochium bolleyi]